MTLPHASFLICAVTLMLTSCSHPADPATARPQAQSDRTAPVVTLDASARDVSAGERVTLSWQAMDAQECHAGGGWSGKRNPQGAEDAPPLTASVRFELRCKGPGGETSSALTVAVRGKSSFPLRVGGRHLLDANGAPFLIQGDAAWSLIVQLDREGTEHYLADRRARGFNTLLVNLIEHHFSSQAPANRFGDEPFLKRGDFTQPNEKYFAHADWVLQRAEEMGFAVLLVPAYLGWEGGDDGWYKDLLASTDETLRGYGAFVGKRYGRLHNIIWTYGGDFDPPQKRVVTLIAEGVRSVNPEALGSAHNGPYTSPATYWKGESWLDINNVYTLDPVYLSALAEYSRWRAKPFFFMEGAYENERNASVTRVRTQAYHALLSGAAGQVFGNSPVWDFNAPTAPFPNQTPWREALGQPGSVSMTHVWDAFSERRWWLLEPDESNETLIGGLGEGHLRAVAALARDKSFAMVYVPKGRTIQVDLRRLNARTVSAVWMNAATGARTTATGSPFAPDAAQSLSTPSAPSAEASDWLLLLESIPPGS